MTYPTLSPSSRTYSHGDWPVSNHRFMTGRSQRTLHANAKTQQTLKLTYENQPLEDFDAVLLHYEQQQGTNKAFNLPEIALFEGWDKEGQDDALLGSIQLWRYNSEPRIRSRRGGLGTLEVDLITSLQQAERLYDCPTNREIPSTRTVEPRTKTASTRAYGNVLNTVNWTHTRFRLRPGSINYNFPYVNEIDDNPEGWMLGREPQAINYYTHVDPDTGQEYSWPIAKYSLQVRPYCNSTSGNNDQYLTTPCFDAGNGISAKEDSPLSEFYDGDVTIEVLKENFRAQFYVEITGIQISQPASNGALPWNSPQSVSVPSNTSTYFYRRGTCITCPDFDVPGLEGGMYVAGFDFQVWVPECVDNEKDPQNNGIPLYVPYKIINGRKARWREDGEGGRWINVNSTYNNGVYGGGEIIVSTDPADYECGRDIPTPDPDPDPDPEFEPCCAAYSRELAFPNANAILTYTFQEYIDRTDLIKCLGANAGEVISEGYIKKPIYEDNQPKIVLNLQEWKGLRYTLSSTEKNYICEGPNTTEAVQKIKAWRQSRATGEWIPFTPTSPGQNPWERLSNNGNEPNQYTGTRWDYVELLSITADTNIFNQEEIELVSQSCDRSYNSNTPPGISGDACTFQPPDPDPDPDPEPGPDPDPGPGPNPNPLPPPPEDCGGGGGGGGGITQPQPPVNPPISRPPTTPDIPPTTPDIPDCPPGTNPDGEGGCAPAPDLFPGDDVYLRYTNDLSLTFQSSGCLADEDGCTALGRSVVTVCSQEYTSTGKWPFTLEKTFQGSAFDKFVFSPEGCSGGLFNNRNNAGTWIRNPEHEDSKWEFFDADGIQVTNDRISSTRWGAYNGCETSTQTGDINIPNAEIVEILKGNKIVWKSSNYISYPDCDRYDDNFKKFTSDIDIRSTEAEPRAASTTTQTFPNISPSRRNITYGDWTINRFGSEQEVTLPLPSTAKKSDVIMDLVFANREDSVARSFLQHYDGTSGTFNNFSVADINPDKGTFAGWDGPISDNVSKGRWVYANAPRVVSVHPGFSTTTVRLINLEPELIDNSNSHAFTDSICPGYGSDTGGGEPRVTSYQNTEELLRRFNLLNTRSTIDTVLPSQYPATGPFPSGWNCDTPIPGLISIPNNFGNDGNLGFIVSSKRYFYTKQVRNCNSSYPVESIFGPSYIYSTSLSDNGDAFLSIGSLSSITSSQVQISPWSDTCSWANFAEIECLGGYTGEDQPSNCEIDEGIPTSGYYCRRLVLRAQWEEYGEPACTSTGVYGGNQSGLGGSTAGTWAHFNVITQIIARVRTTENGIPVQTDTAVYGPVSTPENYSESYNYWPS